MDSEMASPLPEGRADGRTEEVARRALNLLDLTLAKFVQPELADYSHTRLRTGWVVPEVLAAWRDTAAELRAALAAPVVGEREEQP